MLIGQHVTSAPLVRASGLEIMSTGYIVVDGGAPTTVSYMSGSASIPADKADIAMVTAMAGEMLGKKLIYMDAGSGAKQPISESMIQLVAKNITVPLIVGGGIKDPEKAYLNCKAGADIIVIGNGYANTGIAGISTTGNQPFLGVIDEVRFYNAALSLANVNTIVTTPFIITNQPEETCAQIGNQASLSIDVLGSVTYQWQKDGVDIPGATSSIYTISNAQLSDFGLYRCRITSQCDNSLSSISAEVSLGTGNVNITQQPQNTSACSGSPASFSIVLTGPTVFFQWKKNGVNISGATNSTLNLTNVNSSDAGNYTVDILGGSCGTVSSEVATLTVTAVNADVTQTGNTLTAAQLGANYTWVDCNNGNQPIAGANGQSFTPTTIGNYAAIITVNGCSDTSVCVAFSTLGINDLKNNSFQIHPNPASTTINIELDAISNVRLYDIDGKILREFKDALNYSIDISTLKQGVYFFETNEGLKAKFVKQ
jgi:hypothetical protein